MRTYTFAIASLLIVPSWTVAIDIYVDNLLGDDRRGRLVGDSAGETGGPCRIDQPRPCGSRHRVIGS